MFSIHRFYSYMSCNENKLLFTLTSTVVNFLTYSHKIFHANENQNYLFHHKCERTNTQFSKNALA